MKIKEINGHGVPSGVKAQGRIEMTVLWDRDTREEKTYTGYYVSASVAVITYIDSATHELKTVMTPNVLSAEVWFW